MERPADRSSAYIQNEGRNHEWTCPSAPSEVRDFHRSLKGYAPTPLIDLPQLAGELGVCRVFAKDESSRLGLPSFKALGASWAIRRALRDRSDDATARHPVTMVTASDGNHGRAVAHLARQLGHGADIFLPHGVHPKAAQAIRDEGATVTLVAGDYDDAVAAAVRHVANSAEEGAERLLMQDTALEGHKDVADWIVAGYSTLFAEIDDQLAEHGIDGPDLVVVPTGVGSLLQAAITHYRSDTSRHGSVIVSVEPTNAACVLESVAEGGPVTVKTGHTIMAGLNTGTMSLLAWPYVVHGLDAAVAVSDGDTTTAVQNLAELGVDAGPCGAASLAAARVLQKADQGNGRRITGLFADATVVLLVTEGGEANPWLSE